MESYRGEISPLIHLAADGGGHVASFQLICKGETQQHKQCMQFPTAGANGDPLYLHHWVLMVTHSDISTLLKAALGFAEQRQCVQQLSEEWEVFV